MNFYINRRLHDWAGSFALFEFPAVRWLSKLCYVLLAFVSTRHERWNSLEHQTAREWITRWVGSKSFARLRAPVPRLKSFEHAENISAAWIWTRARRIGRSRRSLFQEELGYINDGSETSVQALVEATTTDCGEIWLNTPAGRIEVANGSVTEVLAASGSVHADAVIRAAPTPLLPLTVPDLPKKLLQRYAGILNTRACRLVLKLRRSVSRHFLVNSNDSEIEAPRVVGFSNLHHIGQGAVVFVPYFMTNTEPRWSWTDAALLDEALGYLQQRNPALTAGDQIAEEVSRLRHVQSVCPLGFGETISSVHTPISRLPTADTCFYYPESRGICESFRYGRMRAPALGPAAS